MTATSKIEHIQSILSTYGKDVTYYLSEHMRYRMSLRTIDDSDNFTPPISPEVYAEAILLRIKATLDIPKDL